MIEINNINLAAEELISTLKLQQNLLNNTLNMFDDLTESVKNNNSEMIENLIYKLADSQQKQIEIDSKLNAIRNEIAKLSGSEIFEINVETISKMCDSKMRDKLLEIRNDLRKLAAEIEHRHLENAYMIFEASRVNRMLFEGLFMPKAVTTYDRQAVKGKTSDASLISTEI